MNKNIKDLEEEQEYEADSNDVPPSDVMAFNELRSCADLLRLYDKKQLEIQPEFQRESVWSKPAQTRFIDSLTKQLPIPSMCIGLDYKTEKRLIIDGLQRMQSIICFLSDDNWELSNLSDIDGRLSGKTVSTIKEESLHLYERVENVTIPVTVIRYDSSKDAHNEYLFTIFHRLNSGGMRLNNQEIRNCIYSGEFNNTLKKLAEDKHTKEFFGAKKRFSNEEMILRFFAFNERLENYKGRLATFLNNYMFDNRKATKTETEELYLKSVEFICRNLIEKPYKKLSKTVLEGLLYGISQNIEHLKSKNRNELEKLFKNFTQLPEYNQDNLKSALSDKEKVKERLLSSKECFSR